MKKFSFALFCLFAMDVSAQSYVVTSASANALANHNQRKLVRDNLNRVHLIYEDMESDTSIIKYIYSPLGQMEWSSPFLVTNGFNPSLAIGRENEMSVVFQSNGNYSSILLSTQKGDGSWTVPVPVLETGRNQKLPVADYDSSGRLNIVWIEEIVCGPDIIRYIRMGEQGMEVDTILVGDRDITDVAVATNLQYSSNRVYFTYQSKDNCITNLMYDPFENKLDTIFTSIGTMPNISVGKYRPDAPDSMWIARNIFMDSINRLGLAFTSSLFDFYEYYTLIDKEVTYLCLDDVFHPFGFNFLYMAGDTLFQVFASEWESLEPIDTITGDPINPTIAYKHFRSDSVDFAWMKSNGGGYDIYFKRSVKVPVSIHPAGKKDLRILISPNPVTLNKDVVIRVICNSNEKPTCSVFRITGEKVEFCTMNEFRNGEFQLRWNASKFGQGIYMAVIEMNGKAYCRKLVVN